MTSYILRKGGGGGGLLFGGNKFRGSLSRDRDFFLFHRLKMKEERRKFIQQSKRVHQEIGSKHRNNPIDYIKSLNRP